MDEYEFERDYWGDCCNTFDEDQKHYVYAKLMGLSRVHYSFDVGGKSIIDIGGGPSSMMLKCINLKSGHVVDPIDYPNWTKERYRAHNITVSICKGEDFTNPQKQWDEAWIYNCLQHTEDPGLLISNAFKCAPVLRIFEWIDVPPHDGHPIELTEQNLNQWCGGKGGTVTLAESGCYGRAYYGVFKK